MNATRLPGFTAATSLLGPLNQYAASSNSDTSPNTRAIVPQSRCYSPQPGVICCWYPWAGWLCIHRHILA